MVPVYNEVFQRVEKKYRVSASQRRVLEEAMRRFMEPDTYGLSRVTSVYLDTPERYLVARSLEKPLYKEKLRVRAYGREAGRALVGAFCRGASADDSSTLVFIELKKKFKGVVYKRRVGVSLAAARAYLEGAPYAEACARCPLLFYELHAESLSPRSLQIAREIDAMRERCAPLMPSMAIACDRVAWKPQEHCAAQLGDLRVTFDGRLAFSDCGSAWRPIVEPSESIMELKSSGALPLWLAESLAVAGAYPSSFSKYGRAAQLVASAEARTTPLRTGGGPGVSGRQGGKRVAKYFAERQITC